MRAALILALVLPAASVTAQPTKRAPTKAAPTKAAPGQATPAEAAPAAASAPTPASRPAPASAPTSTPAGAPASAPATQPELPPDPEAPTVSARLDRTEGRVGDVFLLTITAVHSRAVAVNLPSTLDLKAFALLEKLPELDADLGNGRLKRDFQLKVAAYETGDLQLPGLEVTYLNTRGEARTVRTQPIDVRILSVLANENDPQLKPNAGPVPVRQRDLTLIYTLAGILLVALGVVVGFVLRSVLRARARRAVPPPPPRPAHEIALERLDALRGTDLLQRQEFKEFYLRLSEILREYLGRRYGFPALDLTTTEILEALGPRAELARRDGGPDLGAWLFSSDLVKFAKYTPTITEAAGALSEGYAIVDCTRVWSPAPPDSAETTAARAAAPAAAAAAPAPVPAAAA
ncbi:MAG: hypothetical protein HY906_06490, partial [Deltaproteobacteria bacterium]|nr:hypothetical protein [Deltaproteobacteria bacterium]